MTIGTPNGPLDSPTDLPPHDHGPLGDLPRFSRRQLRVGQKLGRTGPPLVLDLIAAWNAILGGDLNADRFDVDWRAAGIKRPGVVAQLAWPRLRTRVALGIDPPLAHAVVDRLLGYRRTPAAARLQVSPVEWGVLSFLLAHGLDRLESHPGPFGPWDLTIDRVGPDPFLLADLGPVVTWRWRVRVGALSGTARLWLAESLVAAWLEAGPISGQPLAGPPPNGAGFDPSRSWRRFASLSSEFHAEIGTATIHRSEAGAWLEPGRLLLLDHSPWTGTPASPHGMVALTQTGDARRVELRARVEPGSRGDRLILTSGLQLRPTLRNPTMVDAAPEKSESSEPTGPENPTDASKADPSLLTVTLIVELGRVNLPLPRLAELQPGDVIELARHSRQPVDLSSNGRLVARGELVQVDTELGVKILQVFF